MYSPAGLEGWEIVAASGLCAMLALCVFTLIAVIVTLFATRERGVARAPVAARPAVAPAQPAFGKSVASPAAAS